MKANLQSRSAAPRTAHPSSGAGLLSRHIMPKPVRFLARALTKGLCALALGSALAGNWLAAAPAPRPRAVAPLMPLTVTKSGEGVVTPGFLGTSLRPEGSAILVKAAPVTGYLFHSWSGSVSSTAPTLRFTLKAGTNLRANFVLNPFPAVRGCYSGIFSGDGPAGSLSLSLLPSGAFTAKLKVAGVPYPFFGTMSPEGTFHGNVPRPGRRPLVVDLALDVANGTGALAGTVTDGAAASQISGERAMADAGGSAPLANRYTILLPANYNDPSQPEGVGFATLSLDEFGAARLAGVLGDGTPVTGSANVTQSGALFLHLTPAGGRGMLQGRLVFADEPGVSDLHGSVRWVKPPSPGGQYPAGFDATLDAVGSAYTAPAPGELALDLPPGPDHLQFSLGCGNLRDPINKVGTLGADGHLTISSPGADRLAVTVNNTTGYVSGTFLDPVTHVPRALRGVLFQKRNIAAGVFRGTTESGYFNLMPFSAAD